jgi:small subunit ribosomal protein S20
MGVTVANIQSAEKRNRQAQKRRVRNAHVRTGVKGALRKAREAVGQGDKALAKQAVDLATRSLERAASGGVLHRNTASRKISRLRSLLAKGAPGPGGL